MRRSTLSSPDATCSASSSSHRAILVSPMDVLMVGIERDGGLMRGDARVEQSAEPAHEHQAGVDFGLGLPHVQAPQQPAERLLGTAGLRFELGVVIVRLRKRRAQLERTAERALRVLVPLRDVRTIDLILREHAFEPAESCPRGREAIVGLRALAIQRSRSRPRVRLARELIGLEIQTCRPPRCAESRRCRATAS